MSEYTHEQIAQLLAERTQGEWRAIGSTVHHAQGLFWWLLSADVDESHNARFIAAAPDIVAQLLAENADLKAHVKEYHDALRKGGYSLIKKHIVHDEGIAFSDEEIDQLMVGIKKYVADLYGDDNAT